MAFLSISAVSRFDCACEYGSVRVSSNIYFNSIEEIPYSHCPIKVLKFNIQYTPDCRMQYGFDGTQSHHIIGRMFLGRNSNSVFRSKRRKKNTLTAITIIIMTNRISKQNLRIFQPYQWFSNGDQTYYYNRFNGYNSIVK